MSAEGAAFHPCSPYHRGDLPTGIGLDLQDKLLELTVLYASTGESYIQTVAPLWIGY